MGAGKPLIQDFIKTKGGWGEGMEEREGKRERDVKKRGGKDRKEEEGRRDEKMGGGG